MTMKDREVESRTLTARTFSSPRHTTRYWEAGPVGGPLMIFLPTPGPSEVAFDSPCCLSTANSTESATSPAAASESPCAAPAWIFP